MSIELLEQEFGRWITPDQQAGLAPPENLYDASGTPLPYYQEEGGPRQFRSVDGQAYAPSETPLRGMSSLELAPLPNVTGTPFPPRQPNHVQIPMELRGRTGETPRGPGLDRPGLDMPESAYPDAGPQNLLPGRGMGTHPVIPIPPAPTNRIRVPSEAQERVGLQSNAQRAIGDTVARQAITNRALSTALYPNGGSTTPTPQSQGPAPSRNNNPHPMDRFQEVLRRPGATIRDMLDAGGLSFDFFGTPTAAPQQELPTVDARADSNSVQRVSTNPRGGFVRPANAGQWEGRAPEIEELLLSRNIRLTAGAAYRTGNARRHGHPEGNSIDIPPDQYEAAIAAIRADPRFANIPMQPRFVRRGTDFGNGVVATGDHYHVDLGPVARR